MDWGVNEMERPWNVVSSRLAPCETGACAIDLRGLYDIHSNLFRWSIALKYQH